MRYDVVIVGGGPVGLHAALKAAVLNHTVLVVDKGRAYSRVAQAQAIANVPFAPGIAGPALLDALRRDLDDFARLKGKRLVDVWDGADAFEASRDDAGFCVRTRGAQGEREARGRVLVLATGVVDRKLGIDRYHEHGHGVLAPYLRGDEVGYCILCEGWHLEGKRVAVVGDSPEAAQVAVDVARHFGAGATLLTDGAPVPDAHALREAGVAARSEPIAAFEDEEGRLRIAFDGAPALVVDEVFFHLGWYKANNELAVQLGAAVDREGLVRTTESCEALDAQGKPIRGLFVVGDLRSGAWKQIVVGWGDAETAIITAYAKRLPD